jgi:hypothetical protein
VPNVVDNEQLYNHIILGTPGVGSPGVVTLSGHDRKVNWLVRNGYALDGASVTFQNIPPVKFKASFYLVKDPGQGIDDYADWDVFKKVIESTLVGATPHALAIYHPDLIENDIKAVCKAQVGGRVYDRKGGCTVVVEFQEYRFPKKKAGTPVGDTGVDPHAALKAKLAAVTLRYQQTPWQ